MMMGFAGQLSLGHALYVGLGGYVAAGLFFITASDRGPALRCGRRRRRRSPATIIGYLGFRFSLAGVYFALLTIAFAEFTRIAFDHWSGPAARAACSSRSSASSAILINLRGRPILFYYVILALAAGAFILCRALLQSRARPLLARHPRGCRGGAGRRRRRVPLQDVRGR